MYINKKHYKIAQNHIHITVYIMYFDYTHMPYHSLITSLPPSLSRVPFQGVALLGGLAGESVTVDVSFKTLVQAAFFWFPLEQDAELLAVSSAKPAWMLLCFSP